MRIIPRRFIKALSTSGESAPFKDGSGRYELAQAVASKGNPLTARALVNRIWMHHFGEGLVKTPDDLGNQAGDPSHRELLDFLSTWFVEDLGPGKPAWSVKALHKAIMLSSTYQQSSKTAFRNNSFEIKLDPANNLLWHANVRRLDFEAFHDSLLEMTGALDRTSIGGPSVNIIDEPYSLRRSVYAYIDRGYMLPLLTYFDIPNPDQSNSKRTPTIVPQQALFLMNSSFVEYIAEMIVRRPEVEQAIYTDKNTRAGIIAIFRIILQRTPTVQEEEMATEFLIKEGLPPFIVNSVTNNINQGLAGIAANNVKTPQNNNGKKAVLNDTEFEGTNVTLTKGSSIVTNVENTQEIRVGVKVTGAGILADTNILAVSETSVTLSKNVQTSTTSAKICSSDIVRRRFAFSPWNSLVKAILFFNEAAYVN